ncbi:Transcriptional regulatory protein FixJ [Burkholderiaceae bacterium]|nr:Transcriptional regulatory protein FixJ [Burkholderiaceae bacterium]
MTTRTIFIVDDNNEFRQSAQWWLASAGYDVIDFADPAAALDALQQQPPREPACLLLDVRMPGMSGLDLHDRLHQRGVRLPTIYMTGHGDVPLAVQAMQKGAISFLEKPFAHDALEQALDQAFAAAAELREEEAALAWRRRMHALTPREREVLDWVVEDKPNKGIAELMGISIKTVELHRKRVMDKLQAQSVTHLIKMVLGGRVV